MREFKPAENTTWSSYDWLAEMSRLRSVRPRPIKKLFGAKGPTPDQLADYKTTERSWNSSYRHARKMYEKTREVEKSLPEGERRDVYQRYMSRR